MDFESAKVPDSGESASRVQAADEMLRIANILRRG
jgi:hypothetical protein